MGDKGGGTRTADYMTHLANYYHQLTAPLTKDFVGRGRMLMDEPGKFAEENIYGSPIYQQTAKQLRQSIEPARSTLEGQYQRAQENLISNMPSGGTLTSSLANLDMGRARELANMRFEADAVRGQQLSRLAQSMWADEMQRAYGMGTMTPAQSMSSLGSAAAAQAQANAAQSAGKYGALGDLGMGAGAYFGGKAGAGG